MSYSLSNVFPCLKAPVGVDMSWNFNTRRLLVTLTRSLKLFCHFSLKPLQSHGAKSLHLLLSWYLGISMCALSLCSLELQGSL